MPIGKFSYCWDSCVFISLLTGQGRTPEDLANLRRLETLVDIGAVTIFTASITVIEVLACYLTEEQEAAFKSLLQRTNVMPVSVTMRISERARDIRNYYRKKGMEIAVPDSIHLATASIYKAAALHTFDGCGKRQRKTDLLKLELPLAEKYHLKICKPAPPEELESEDPIEPIEPHEEMGNLFAEIEDAKLLPASVETDES